MKPICIIEQYADLDSLNKEFDSRFKFVMKKVEDLQKEAKANKEEFWAKASLMLEQHNLLKDAKKKDLVIMNGVLYEKEPSECDKGILDAIKGIFT